MACLIDRAALSVTVQLICGLHRDNPGCTVRQAPTSGASLTAPLADTFASVVTTGVSLYRIEQMFV